MCRMTAGAAGRDSPVPSQPASPPAEASPPGDAGEAGAHAPPRAATVLADRMAAALVHREPGWRLPRRTALARRYNVGLTEIDAALGDLIRRSLVRRLPDGQLYRASPAEYLIPLEGTAGLASYIDPMGSQIACRSRQVSWRRVPEDIGWTLGVAPGESACVIRLLWTADGEPAALATTYLARHLAAEPAGQGSEPLTVPPAALAALPLLAVPGTDDMAAQSGAAGTDDAAARASLPGTTEGAGQAPGAADEDPARAGDDDAADAAPGAACQPRALFIELHPPPPAVARSLRLSAGQPAAMVTVRFDDPVSGRPAALTVVVLRPDMFRIVVESPAGPLSDGTAASFSGAWTYASQDWEP